MCTIAVRVARCFPLPKSTPSGYAVVSTFKDTAADVGGEAVPFCCSQYGVLLALNVLKV